MTSIFPNINRIFCQQKTVIAVLDSLINPEWPFLPLRDSDGADVREKWQHLIDTPTRYHFYFRILDGDRYGRKPYCLQDANGSLLKDELYEHRDNSCLHALCFADDNTVRHILSTIPNFLKEKDIQY